MRWLIEVATAMHADGFAVIDPDRERLLAVADAKRAAHEPAIHFDHWREQDSGGLRVQNAWRFLQAVTRLASSR